MTAGVAEKLWTARTSGGVIAMDGADSPGSDSDAYAVQAKIVEISGARQIGWKLGATTEQSLKLLGFKEPFFGPLLDRYFHPNGADVPLVPDHNPGIESEFVVGLGADLPPRAESYTREEVEEAIAWIAPGFEIVGCRIRDGFKQGGNPLIADGGVNMTFVQGEPVKDWRRFDLTGHPVSLTINGEQVASGHSGLLVYGDTVAAVLWLANHPEIAARGLKQGEIITTGTCTGLIPISPGDKAVADFGEIGEVRARFVS